MKEKQTKATKNRNSAPSKPKEKKENPLMLWAMVAGLIILTGIVFFPMLQNQFTGWDDPSYITKNQHIWKLNAENINYIFTQPIALNYHPLTMLSLAINYSFSQLNPYSYYLTNLLLHLCNVGLVFYFIYLLSNKNSAVAMLSALVFAIHPMHVESVAWAAERKDVLYVFFFIPGLIAYINYQNTKKQMYFYVTLLLALLSMLSKPAAIIFPFVLILLDYYRYPDFEFKKQLNKIPFFILSAFFVYMTVKAQTMDNFDIGHYKNYTLPERFVFACYGFIIYIAKLFVPFQLAAFHPYPESIGPQFYIMPLLVIGILLGVLFWKSKRKLLLFGFGFYLINVMLVLQLYSVGDALIAERYTYVPYIGLAFMIGMLLFDSSLKINRNIILGVIGVYGLLFAYTANSRVKVWNNTETLWTDMIEKYPESDRGYYDRGNYYSRKNEYEKALADFTKAIELGHDYRSYNNRGQANYKLQRYEESIKDYSSALQLDSSTFRPFLNRAYSYYKLKNMDAALMDATKAIKLQPGYDVYFFRGTVYNELQRLDEAANDLENAITYEPNKGNTYLLLANVYEKKGDKAKADELAGKGNRLNAGGTR